MPYNRQIPDAPIAGSMLPRPTALTAQDLLLLIQPGNNLGQKNKALTLAMLAAFLGNSQFDEITITGANGKTLVLNGDGTTFTRPPTPGTLDQFQIVENSDGIKVSDNGPRSSGSAEIAPTAVTITRTIQGLTNTLTIASGVLTFTRQERVEGQVVTIEKKIGPDQSDVEVLNFFSSEFPGSSWYMGVAKNTDANMGELVLGFNGSNSMNRLILRAKLFVALQAVFDKDVTVNADMLIEKTLKIEYGGPAEFKNGGLTLSGWLTVAGMTILSTIQQDLSSNNASLIKCSESANPTLPNYVAGRRLMVINDTQNQHLILGGSRTWALNGLRAAEFIKTGSTADDWYPIVSPNSNS